MTLFDSHCHLFDEQFSTDVETILAAARTEGVTRFVIPAVDVASGQRALELAQAHEGVYGAVGLHPESLNQFDEEDFKKILELAQNRQVVAIGEIGLDYHWDVATKEVQQKVFRKQLEIAKELGLPVIVHNRDATEDTVRILREATADGSLTGVMHCFTGSVETAKQCMDLGFYISFGGPVTFKNARRVQETAAQIPLDRLLVETDSPYLSPHPFRGKRNEPARVRLVAEKLAELKEKPLEDIAAITTANACRLFGVD